MDKELTIYLGVTKTPTLPIPLKSITLNLESPYFLIYRLSEFSPTCFRRQIQTFPNEYVCGKCLILKFETGQVFYLLQQ